MNKKLIAAAVAAGLAAPMMAAHAEVSVYGIAQLELVNTSPNTGNSTTEVKDSKNSRIGVRWSEDLGDGLKAIGEFEWGPNLLDASVKDTCTTTATVGTATTAATCTPGSSNANGLYARQQWLGMSGGFGELQVGTVLQPYKYSGGVKYDAFVATQAEARGGDGGMLKSAFGQGGYFSNAIAYKKSFGAMSFWAAYSPEQRSDSGNVYPGAKGDLMASFVFKFGKGEAGVAYAKNNNASGTTGADGQANTKVFGKYGFGNSTILAQYEASTSNGSSQEGALLKNGSTTEYTDMNVWFLGYQLKLPAMNTLIVQYGVTSFSDNNQENINYAAIGVRHNFSKNTSAFLAYRNTTQDAFTQGATSYAKVDNSVITLGLTEKF